MGSNGNPMGPIRFSNQIQANPMKKWDPLDFSNQTQANPMNFQWGLWDSVHEIPWKPMEFNGIQWNSNH